MGIYLSGTLLYIHIHVHIICYSFFYLVFHMVLQLLVCMWTTRASVPGNRSWYGTHLHQTLVSLTLKKIIENAVFGCLYVFVLQCTRSPTCWSTVRADWRSMTSRQQSGHKHYPSERCVCNTECVVKVVTLPFFCIMIRYRVVMRKIYFLSRVYSIAHTHIQMHALSPEGTLSMCYAHDPPTLVYLKKQMEQGKTFTS